MIIKGTFANLSINTDQIMKDIEKDEADRRNEAAKYAVKAIKEKIKNKKISTPGNAPGRLTGNLYKSIKSRKSLKSQERVSAVGSTAPHAHLLEFGHGDGKEINKRPFFRSTLLEESKNIEDILSREYF
jgi:HK97 gp10 family phage protein